MTTISMSEVHVGNRAETVVLGVDTHKDTHVAAVLTLTGEVMAHASFPTTRSGYGRLIAWARSHGEIRRAGVEGTGSYGAALARALQAEQFTVLEVNRPDRAVRRRRGKTDVIDAENAARAVLAGEATAQPKTGDGPVEMLRVFKVAKDSAIKARTQSINQLKALLVSADPRLREQLTDLSAPRLITACAALDPTEASGPDHATLFTLKLLADRIQYLTTEVNELTKRMTTAVETAAPSLLEQPGIGPDSAAVLLIAAGDNPDRLTNEASFAALCGVSPLDSSSGKTSRRRLNRGGDRQANAALYRITLSRLRWDSRTQDYLAKRTIQGKTRRETIRCLKRYIAREVHRIIINSSTLAPQT
jgi:transposase